jgi:hypothetical protein
VDLCEEPLAWDHCVDLSERIRPGDRMECLSMGNSPLQALSTGIMTGKASAALRRSGACMGAFGWSFQGTIWSLWASDLTTKEKLQILRQTPEWVSSFVQTSGRDYLWNYVAANNIMGIAWLRASRCFWIEDDEPRLIVSGEPFYYFQTLPACANRKVT